MLVTFGSYFSPKLAHGAVHYLTGELPSASLDRGQLVRIVPYMSLELHVEERCRWMARESEKPKPGSRYATNGHTTELERPLWRLYTTKSYTELTEFVLTILL